MSSPLAIFTPLFRLLPEVKSPATPPTFSQKMVWTLLALVIFFAMYHPAAALHQASLKETIIADMQKIPPLLKELAQVEIKTEIKQAEPQQLNLF